METGTVIVQLRIAKCGLLFVWNIRINTLLGKGQKIAVTKK